MIEQRLAPGVQHGRNADLCLEPFPPKLQQRGTGCLEQELEQNRSVLPDQPVERVRQREHQMEVGNGQERALLLFEPIRRPPALALRAVTVAATVRHEMFALAMDALEQL